MGTLNKCSATPRRVVFWCREASQALNAVRSMCQTNRVCDVGAATRLRSVTVSTLAEIDHEMRLIPSQPFPI